MTAVDHVDCTRIDHQGFVPEIWAGLLITALYLMQIGPNIPNLSDYLEDVLSLLLFLGSGICLVGAVLGTKWFFRKIRRKVSYVLQLVGLPMIIFTLGFYTYASVDTSEMLITALAGGLGLCIEIASVRMMVDLVQELTDPPPTESQPR
jgi:hypothetical protein